MTNALSRKVCPVRRKPSTAVSIVLFAIYIAIIFAFWSAKDFKYDEVSDTLDNVKNGVVFPVGVGALFLALAATVLGWWGPAIKEPLSIGTKATKFIVPALVVGAALNLAVTDWDNVTGEFALWLVIGVLLVGFSEEMLCRGLGLVGFRGSMPERKAWIASGLMFGILHVPNAFFGQSALLTVQQIVFAFVFGTVYYTVRRATGTLIIPMLLHALWDGSLFVNDHSGKSASPFANIFMAAAAILTGIAIRHWMKADKENPATQVVTA